MTDSTDVKRKPDVDAQRRPDEVVMLPSRKEIKRVETGKIQFGEDWPGIFIRGDHAFGYAVALESLLNNECNPISENMCDGLKELLYSVQST